MTLANRVERGGAWAAAAIGASIPVSVALDNILLAVCLAAWLAGGAYREKLTAVRGNAVVLAALALFALLAAGTAWGLSDARTAAQYLMKYSDLLMIAPLAWLLREPAARQWALHALAAALGVVLLLSYLIWLGIMPPVRWLLGEVANPVVFKHYLTHNVLMAYGAYLYAEFAVAARTARGRAVFGAACVLAAANVLFLVQGRTGYVVLATLALYAGWRVLGRRGLAGAGAASFALAAVLLAVPGTFQDRWRAMTHEFQVWRGNAPPDSSAVLRLEYYANTLAIIREHPLLGVGTGGFPKAYAERMQGSGAVQTRNPHNEYLHIAAQTGIAGLTLLLLLFYTQWRNAPRLATPQECHLARALVLTIGIGCLFNSLLLDHTEGLLFAWLTAALYGGLQSKGERVTSVG